MTAKSILFICGLFLFMTTQILSQPTATQSQPLAPGTPSQPVTPSTPSQPVTPGTLSQPITPGTPSQPVTPGTPSQPVSPGTPSQPVSPGTPSQPVAPITPSQPDAIQNQPVAPDTLSQPSVTPTPSQSVTPSTSSQPVAAVTTQTQPIADGIFRIANQNSGLLLDVDGASLDDGAGIIQYPENGGSNQRWLLSYQGEQTSGSLYKIHSDNSGKALANPAGSSDAGIQMIQYTDNGLADQQWIVQDAGDGSFFIQNYQSGLYLEILDSSMDPAGLLVQCPFKGDPSQKFILYPVQ